MATVIKVLAIGACSSLPDVRIPVPKQGETFVKQLLGAKDALPGQVGGYRSSGLGADQRSVVYPHLPIFPSHNMVQRGCSSFSMRAMRKLGVSDILSVLLLRKQGYR